MKYVCSVDEFLSCYFNQQMPYAFDKLNFAEQSNLDYLLWSELASYCQNNLDNNVELYALLSDMHRFGKGVVKDENLSNQLLDNGVQKGSLFCLNKKANQLIDRGLVTFEYDQALELLNKGAQQNFLPAINNLAWMYQKGCGVKRDGAYAQKLYQKAMEGGCVVATYNYGLSVKYDDETSGMQYIKKSAELGYAVAQNHLGQYFADKQDYAQAFFWFKKAALADNPFAFKNLGDMYRTGNGAEQNDQMAIFCYKQAVSLGYDNAKGYIAQMLCNTQKNCDDIFGNKNNLPDDCFSDDE